MLYPANSTILPPIWRCILFRAVNFICLKFNKAQKYVLLNTIKIVQGRLNTELEIEGILLTMYDTRLRLANQVVEEVKMHFQEIVFDTVIHRNTKLGEAPSYGETIIMHDAGSKGAINYLNLTRELLQKNNLTNISNEDKKINISNEL